MYQLGVVGNCHVNAVIAESGSVDWLCFPYPDSPPLFGRLLDSAGGDFSISSSEGEKGIQNYIPNTNILQTTFTQKNGSAFRVTDFCPRFESEGAVFRPSMLVRIVEPLKDSPMIRVHCRPVDGWTKKPLDVMIGNNLVQFSQTSHGREPLQLRTNMPLTYFNSDTTFALHEPLYFVLTWGFPLEGELRSTVDHYLLKTTKYWTTWVKHCSIPPLYQDEVIRSALALKLHCFEDTGAILASLTTSLPEEVQGVRNWDYRLCWLRDSYFSLSAFHSLGQFEESEGFTRFMLNIALKSDGKGLHPVYKLDGTLPLPELSHENWAGFESSKPVRSGNEAATHVQNDVYGEAILAIAPLFFDDRFIHLRSQNHEKLLDSLVAQCISALGVSDAGVWELRSKWQVHSFSTLLCWAGMERVSRLLKKGHCSTDLEKLLLGQQRALELIKEATIDGSVRNSPEDPSFDASLVLMAILRYPDKDLSRRTVEKIYEELTLKEDGKKPAFFYRYLKKDDFGRPKSAFLACSFWAAHAFACIGDKETARYIIDRALEAKNSLGLFSEHYDPVKKVQLGNFPQAYSHMGLINSAFAVSPLWSDIL